MQPPSPSCHWLKATPEAFIYGWNILEWPADTLKQLQETIAVCGGENHGYQRCLRPNPWNCENVTLQATESLQV